MQWLDWFIVAVPVAVVAVTAIYARRYLKSVADFMAGGRHAGRYLLCTAKSEMGAGAVIYVSSFEIFGKAGFSIRWWGQLSFPVTLIIAISGFVIYRYRQTRALTLAQFFEMRYSRKFRLFTGVLALFAGMVNFGIMPVIGARFMVYFLNLPLSVHILSIDVKTYLILMGIFLSVCVLTTIGGGQITVILTDCIQGMFSQVFYVGIAIALLLAFNWARTRGILLNHPKGESAVNPFDSFSVKDWNIWFVLMTLFGGVYGTMAWQNQHAFNSSAAILTKHVWAISWANGAGLPWAR
jgi:SSS family solute:Na+ symporter